MPPDLQDAAVERWLQEEVAPVYDALKTNPERKLSAKSVFSEARARYGMKHKARSCGSNAPSE
jgi:antitoxin ParD1/3/4